MVINTASPLSPPHQTIAAETGVSPMDQETSEPAGPKNQALPQISSLSPTIQALESLVTLPHCSIDHRGSKPKSQNARSTIADTVPQDDLQDHQRHMPSTSTALTSSPLTSNSPERVTHLPPPTSFSDVDEVRETEFESDVYVRSTMEDALVSPRKFPSQPLGEISSDISCNTSPVREFGPEPLFSSNRALIRQFFTEFTTICLPQGYPTIALTEGQICSNLEAVANERARVSFKMLTSVVEKPSLVVD